MQIIKFIILLGLGSLIHNHILGFTLSFWYLMPTPFLFFFIIRSMLARDMQSIVLYDQEGKFAGVRRPNSNLPIDIDGIRIVVLDAIGSTGLEIKVMGE